MFSFCKTAHSYQPTCHVENTEKHMAINKIVINKLMQNCRQDSETWFFSLQNNAVTPEIHKRKYFLLILNHVQSLPIYAALRETLFVHSASISKNIKCCIFDLVIGPKFTISFIKWKCDEQTNHGNFFVSAILMCNYKNSKSQLYLIPLVWLFKI